MTEQFLQVVQALLQRVKYDFINITTTDNYEIFFFTYTSSLLSTRKRTELFPTFHDRFFKYKEQHNQRNS